MNFCDLPDELVLKIFSYLPQRYLPAIAEVSYRWRQLAFDPLLWTEVTITPRGPTSAEHITEILERAFLLRKLDVSRSVVDLDEVALASHRFGLLNEFVIPSTALTHRAMARILKSCESVTTVVLRGRGMLLENQVTVLETLSSLKSLLVCHKLEVCDYVFAEVCLACPGLEQLKINSDSVFESRTWSFLRCLPKLTILSVTKLTTDALLQVSKCANLESLKTHSLWNVDEMLTARALQGFAKLKSLKVKGYWTSDWFNSRFCMPTSLQCLDVSGAPIGKPELELVVRSCRVSLQDLTIDIRKMANSTLSALSAFENIESICIYGVCGDHSILPMLCKFPKLVRAKLHVEDGAVGIIFQLRSIVDVSETSPRGSTRAIINLICSSQASHDDMGYALGIFKNFLALHTNLSREHICDLEKQINCPKGEPQRAVNTSFSVQSKTLKNMVLHLFD
ncbi:hypothetical protein HPB48_026501 [Haemaphysalis longicornis]|uniref:F-box domain-containing protein n=1 Tax=Haemaphysalis longicornis TaxID=44386 RepID=A0A9J6HCG4_HAELO|nr:hypothetical protein HPB48_026501 [Haemaphysalis longicornis]